MGSASDKANAPELLYKIAGVVSDITGIEFGAKNHAMVQSRIYRRMAKVGIDTVEAYLDYLNSHLKEETQALVSLLTTHHTRFFREFSHFEFLRDVALPKLVDELKKEGKNKIKIWSAACSTGHEVYLLAMFLKKHLKEIEPSFDFEILGTDVDALSIKVANNGVYKWEELKEAPAAYIMQNWSRGEGEISNFVKARSELKKHCRFEVENLVQLDKLKTDKFHIIFCRNVFIYFKQENVTKITNEMLNRMHPKGYFVIGTSESLDKDKCLVQYEAPAIYRHRDLVKEKAVTPVLAPAADIRPKVNGASPLRVLCVDDSATILTLLKKVLTSEAGFEVVATAKNGEEAAQILETTKIDVMTLDLHMPVLGGLEYLKKYYKPGHPPVVVVSSVSRENRELAIESLDCGARDYVEKPSMSDLNERGEEIKNKLRVAVSDSRHSYKNTTELERSFQTSNNMPDKKSIKSKVYIVGQPSNASLIYEQIIELKKANIDVEQILPVSNLVKKMSDDLTKNAQKSVVYVAQELDDDCSKLIAQISSARNMLMLSDFTWRRQSVDVETLKKISKFRISTPSLAFHAIEFLRKAA